MTTNNTNPPPIYNGTYTAPLYGNVPNTVPNGGNAWPQQYPINGTMPLSPNGYQYVYDNNSYPHTNYQILSELTKITKRLETIEERLAIISSKDEEKMTRFESLREAFEVFRTLENLLVLEKEDESGTGASNSVPITATTTAPQVAQSTTSLQQLIHKMQMSSLYGSLSV